MALIRTGVEWCRPTRRLGEGDKCPTDGGSTEVNRQPHPQSTGKIVHSQEEMQVWASPTGTAGPLLGAPAVMEHARPVPCKLACALPSCLLCPPASQTGHRLSSHTTRHSLSCVQSPGGAADPVWDVCTEAKPAPNPWQAQRYPPQPGTWHRHGDPTAWVSAQGRDGTCVQ